MRRVHFVRFLVLALTAICAAASSGQTPVTYSCRRPTTGSAAVTFRWYICGSDTNNCALATSSPDTIATLMLHTPGERVRVAGVDSRSRTGARSVASEPWSPIPRTDAPAPDAARFLDNFPNPFNPRTTIRFDLPVAQRVRLAVYGVGGRLVAVLADGVLGAGHHEIAWDGRDARGQAVASGLYVGRLESRGQAQSVRMALIK